MFRLLGASDSRPFRSARFRLFKAWGAGVDGDHAVRCVVLSGGVKMEVDIRDWAGLTYIEPRAIEPVTTDFLLGQLRPGDVVADIGANVGWLTLQVAARVGASGSVWAFEPNPRLVKLLEGSIRRNGFADRVRLAEVALADADDPDRPFYVSQDTHNSGLSSLLLAQRPEAVGSLDPAKPIHVRAITFDRFARESGIVRLDAVKIDVEGAEELVLRGMRESLARFRPRFLVVETALSSPAARVLSEHGYQGRMLEQFGPDPEFGNILFTPTSA